MRANTTSLPPLTRRHAKLFAGDPGRTSIDEMWHRAPTGTAEWPNARLGQRQPPGRLLVAERLVKYARLVGRENVIAGTDCGLGPRVGHPKVAWAKLEALVEGAGLATKHLWGRERPSC